jgi:ubiquinone/menaquinone biosynthesis C-methylase UbiE
MKKNINFIYSDFNVEFLSQTFIFTFIIFLIIVTLVKTDLVNRFKSKLKENIFRNKIPRILSDKFKNITSDYEIKMMESLSKNHFTIERGYEKKYLNSRHGKKALQDSIFTRSEDTRKRIIPWLNSVKSLSDLNIIEVGCGSGTGTSAFAEQVKSVIAIDIDKSILKVCQDRCKLMNLKNVKFYNMEISDYAMAQRLKSNNKSIDAVIFYATLEHMNLDKRISALETAWEILPNGGLIIILDTPNSLFFHDGHTSGLPFHHWISDELAYKYVKLNPKSIFHSKNFLDSSNSAKMDEFISWGRSVSYHDLEVSTKKSIGSLNFLESLSNFEDKKFYYEKKIISLSKKARFQKESITDRYINLMSEYQPDIDPSFFRPYLNIILEKS